MPLLLLLQKVVRLFSGTVLAMSLTCLLVHALFTFFCRPQDAPRWYYGFQIAFQVVLFLLVHFRVVVIYA